MGIRTEERRVILVMLLFALGMVLGRFVAAGLERLAEDFDGTTPGWAEPAAPLTPQHDPEFVVLG
jgi:hypothetical protein